MTLDCTCNRMKEAEEKAAKWDGIVRCHECEHFREVALINGREYRCSGVFAYVKARPDGFCAWARRREDA